MTAKGSSERRGLRVIGMSAGALQARGEALCPGKAAGPASPAREDPSHLTRILDGICALRGKASRDSIGQRQRIYW